MWYELKQTAEDAKGTSEHQRIQQCANFRFNFWRRKNCTEWWYQELNHMMFMIDLTWYYMYTTNLPGMWYEIKQKQQKMPKARANINVYSSTRFSALIFEDEMICIPRTARYVIRIKHKQQKIDAESTSEHQRIQQYAIFRFNFWRRQNCTVWWWCLLVSCYGKAHPCQDGTEAYGEKNPALQ